MLLGLLGVISFADDVPKVSADCRMQLACLSDLSSNFITTSASTIAAIGLTAIRVLGTPCLAIQSGNTSELFIHIYVSNKQGRSTWQRLTALMLCFAVLDAHHRVYCNTESLHNVSQPWWLARTGRKRKCMAPVFQGNDLNGLLACVCTMDWKLDSSTCISTGMPFHSELR